MTTKVIDCQLPMGLVLRVGDQTVNLVSGANEVEADFWSKWVDENAAYGPFVEGKLVDVTPADNPSQDAPEEAPPAPEPAEPPPPAEPAEDEHG